MPRRAAEGFFAVAGDEGSWPSALTRAFVLDGDLTAGAEDVDFTGVGFVTGDFTAGDPVGFLRGVLVLLVMGDFGASFFTATGRGFLVPMGVRVGCEDVLAGVFVVATGVFFTGVDAVVDLVEATAGVDTGFFTDVDVAVGVLSTGVAADPAEPSFLGFLFAGVSAAGVDAMVGVVDLVTDVLLVAVVAGLLAAETGFFAVVDGLFATLEMLATLD